MPITDIQIPALDGYPLAATVYTPDGSSKGVVTINSAMATPRRFYRHYATFFMEHGYTVITYDYRGISGSRPKTLRGFAASIQDWIFRDMDAVLGYAVETYQPEKIFHMGHSFGGQTAGMLANGHHITAMLTACSQSGYWRMQGDYEPIKVLLSMYILFPVLSHLVGFMPWSRLGSTEDLPKGVALDWASWCRNPGYLRGDNRLPLERYNDFSAPVLAYSFDDDTWGTKEAVDDLMVIYPTLARKHIIPQDVGVNNIGHFGFFRPDASGLWAEGLAWLESQG